jgi:hypothetical protein
MRIHSLSFEMLEFSAFPCNGTNTTRRLHYRKQMKEYATAHENRMLVGSGAEDIEKPRWKMLLSRSEMIKMIERGFKVQLLSQDPIISIPERKLSMME